MEFGKERYRWLGNTFPYKERQENARKYCAWAKKKKKNEIEAYNVATSIESTLVCLQADNFRHYKLLKIRNYSQKRIVIFTDSQSR